MTTTISKKTFSLQQDVVSHLNTYSNKSKFVNEALVFYIDYLESTKKNQNKSLEQSLQEALDWEFYSASMSDKNNQNAIVFKGHWKKLEKNLLLALNDN